MDPTYFPPAHRPYAPDSQMLLCANLIVASALLLPPGRYHRNLIALPGLLFTAYALRRHSSGKVEVDYLDAVNSSTLFLKWLDFAVLRVPERSAARVRDDGSVETADEVEKLTVWGKLKWVLSLLGTVRGVGWNWKVKNVDDVPKNVSRR